MRIITFLFIVILFSSCEKDFSPTTKEYHVPTVPNLLINDGETIKFSGQLEQTNDEEIIEYGFVWHPIFRFDYEYVLRDSFVFQGNPLFETFEFNSDEHFIKNFNYQVRIFIKTPQRTIYGPQLEFTSEGTKYNPWTYILHNGNVFSPAQDETFNLFSNADELYLASHGRLYRYNFDSNVFGQISQANGNATTDFIIEDTLYLINKMSNSVSTLIKGDDDFHLRISAGLTPHLPFDDAIGLSLIHI